MSVIITKALLQSVTKIIHFCYQHLKISNALVPIKNSCDAKFIFIPSGTKIIKVVINKSTSGGFKLCFKILQNPHSLGFGANWYQTLSDSNNSYSSAKKFYEMHTF